jgi:hypothetical protein
LTKPLFSKTEHSHASVPENDDLEFGKEYEIDEEE